MSLFQLKPIEQSFFRVCRDLTKKFRAIILCEGDKDATTLKSLIAKMNVQITGNIGITDCGGFPTIREIAAYVASLARLSRKLAKIALIVDANEESLDQRFRSIVDSLRANGVNVQSTQTIAESIYMAKTESLDILIKIAGIVNLSLQSHAMEDYAIQLLIIGDEVEERQLNSFRTAKDFLNQIDREPEEIIRQSQDERVEQAYENIIELLHLISSQPQQSTD